MAFYPFPPNHLHQSWLDYLYWDDGASMPLTVDLQPGHYVVICNIVQTTNGQTVSHYAKKMYTEFTIAP